MAVDPTSNYGYDPFASGDTSSRWGRKAPAGVDIPTIQNYEIRDNLGTGGMGSVWIALYVPLNQIRAVKILDKALAADPTFIDRFSQEARALGRLQHPNIVKVFDANPDHVPPYIALQWIDGKPLSKLLTRQPMPFQDALKILEQVAAALDYAHSMGFIHRDIKPSNVMITDKGDAMLIDFGVASWMGYDPSSSHTLTGTTRYLSPEVIQGRPISASTDVWAFAVLTYRILTGHLPFDDKDSEVTLKKIVESEPEDPKVTGRLKKFLVEMLEKDPKQRYKSAGELVAELKKASLAWVPKVEGEKVAAGSAMALFIAAGVFVVLGLGAAAYTVFNHPHGFTLKAGKLKSLAADLGAASASSSAAEIDAPVKRDVPAANVAPVLEQLKGPWFADLGTHWIDAYLDPSGGTNFRLVDMTRSNVGTVTAEASGSLDSGGKDISFEEKDVIANPTQITWKPVSFAGTVSADRASLLGSMGGAVVKFIRPADVRLSPYDGQADGFSVEIPDGWAAKQSDENGARVTSIAPIGNPNVLVRVIVEPATETTTLADVFARREAVYQADKAAGGDYVRMTTNDSTSFGGRPAASMGVRRQAPGQPSMSGLIYAVLRSGSSIVVESWSPVDQDDIWSPLLERIRGKFTIAE